MGIIKNQIQSFIDAIIWLLARDEPRNLIDLANSMPDAPKIPFTEVDLISVLETSEPADRIKILLGDLIMSFDRFPEDSASWCKTTL